MSNELGARRWSRTFVAVLATIAIAVAAPTAFTSSASATIPAQPTCAAGATPVLYQGQSYCPGTALGVKNTMYGTGKRILLAGVSVTGIRGTTATVSSTTVTPCPPNKYCGATVTITVTSISVSLSGLAVRPTVGSYGDLYGITGVKTLTASAFVVKDGGGMCTNTDFC